MKNLKKFDRKRLREIVESFEGSLYSFEAQPPNTYEQAIAAHSLDELESLYTAIFAPGVGLIEVSEDCPPWPEGTPEAGKQPKVKTLQNIFERFQTDRGLGLLSAAGSEAQQFMKAVKALPAKERAEMLDSILTAMGQEVMSRKMNKIPLSRQLGPVDRLITGKKLDLRVVDQKLATKKVKAQETKAKALEKLSQEAGKKEEAGEAITREGWENLEKEMRLA